MKKRYPFIEELNKQQKIAATTTEGPMLVLAGAGTGKTKTMIARTVYIIAEKKAKPNQILVSTFTNKAAREMKDRGTALLEQIESFEPTQPEFTTFHSWGFRFIKSLNDLELTSLGLKPKFNIGDESEQVAILSKLRNRIFGEEDEKKLSISNFLLPLGMIQNGMVPYTNVNSALDGILVLMEEEDEGFLEGCYNEQLTMEVLEKIALLYVEYKRVLRVNNIVDFEDLIGLPIMAMKMYPALQERTKARYKYIMLDEFQDTNGSQALLIDMITPDTENIAVVGDDSQSIYGWRGAKISFILNFHNKFDHVKVINLKTNYRSCSGIIDRANDLLEHSNQIHEMKEKLEAFKSKEGIVRANMFKNAHEEASYIVNAMKQIIRKRGSANGIAVLYRAAYINKTLETELIFNQIPYKIHRGKSLLDRKASKAVINYIKFLTNRSNSISLSNTLFAAGVLSLPRVSLFMNNADDAGDTLYGYIEGEGYSDIPRLQTGIKDKLSHFTSEARKFSNILKYEDYQDFVREFFSDNIVTRRALDVIEKDLEGLKVSEAALDEARSALNVIAVVQTLMLKFNSIEEFLEVVVLEGEKEDTENDMVNLMTVHASKGLEFDYVFVMGFSQGIFPIERSNREEERRLAYVALTRAKSALFVTGANVYFPNDPPKIMSVFAQEAGLI